MEPRKTIPFGMAMAAFFIRLYKIVDDQATNTVVDWNESGNGFIVRDTNTFARDILPRYFKTRKLESFARQLNKYGFKKIGRPPHWEYVSEDFFRGGERMIMSGEIFHERGLDLPPPTNVENPSAGERMDEVQRFQGKGKRKITDDEDQQPIDIQLTNQQKLLLAKQTIQYMVKAMQTPEFECLLASQMDCSAQMSGDVKRRRLLLNSEEEPSAHQPSVCEASVYEQPASTTTPGSTKVSTSNGFSLANPDLPLHVQYRSPSSTTLDSTRLHNNNGFTLANIDSHGVPYLGSSRSTTPKSTRFRNNYCISIPSTPIPYCGSSSSTTPDSTRLSSNNGLSFAVAPCHVLNSGGSSSTTPESTKIQNANGFLIANSDHLIRKLYHDSSSSVVSLSESEVLNTTKIQTSCGNDPNALSLEASIGAQEHGIAQEDNEETNKINNVDDQLNGMN